MYSRYLCTVHVFHLSPCMPAAQAERLSRVLAQVLASAAGWALVSESHTSQHLVATSMGLSMLKGIGKGVELLAMTTVASVNRGDTSISAYFYLVLSWAPTHTRLNGRRLLHCVLLVDEVATLLPMLACCSKSNKDQ
jgi:hypothetical protein